MKISFSQPETAKSIARVKYVPEIVMVMPFQPLVQCKSALEQQLKEAVAKVEGQLMAAYTMQQAMPVMVRIQQLISSLNFHTHKKSIAVFASPIFDKVIYLDFEVEQKIMVDGAFKLAEIAHIKKQEPQFMLLHLENNATRLYVGNPQGLHLIMQNKPCGANRNGSNKTDDIVAFFSQVDASLSIVLHSHPFPVFVVADDKLISCYQSTTTNDEHISRCLHQPKPIACEQQLHELITPYFANWKQISQQKLMRVLNKANQQSQLVYGLTPVYKIPKQKGSLLVIEDGRTYDEMELNGIENSAASKHANKPFYLHDCVDEIVEKELDCGGDCELVAINLLSKYEHIAYLRTH